MRGFYQRHVQHLRISPPLLPEALITVIKEISDYGLQVQSASNQIRVQVLHVLALAWAAVKNISLQQRKELLDRELHTISSKVRLLQMPVTSVPKVQLLLQQIYFVQLSSVDSAVTDYHREFLQLLPADAHSRASSVVTITGDDAAQYVPRFLTDQLGMVKRNLDAGMLIPPNDSGNPWSTPHGRLQDFPPLPTPSQPGDIWQLETKPASRPPPVTRSMTVTLPRPIVADSPSSGRMSNVASLAYSSRSTRISSQSDIPETMSHVSQSIVFDEHVFITHYLWVVGLVPCTNLTSESLNRDYFIAEQKHIVRMLGTLSEYYLQPPSYDNGLFLDQLFSESNYAYTHDGRRGATLIKLATPATFGSVQTPSSEEFAGVLPMVQRILSAVPLQDGHRKLYMVQAISEEGAEAFFRSNTTLVGVRGLPFGLQCHSITAACILGTAHAVRTSILKSGHIDPSKFNENCFVPLLCYNRHYVKLRDPSSEYPQYVFWRDDKGTLKIPFSREEIPLDVREVDELCLDIVWLEETVGTYGVMFKQLRDSFSKEPVKPFMVCGIPLEMSLSPQTFRRYLSHSDNSTGETHATIITNVRSCITVRDIIHELATSHGNSGDIDHYLIGVFVLHRTQDSTSTILPWSAALIWNGYTPVVDLSSLDNLREDRAVASLGTYKLKIMAALGILQFSRLDNAAKFKYRTSGPKDTTIGSKNIQALKTPPKGPRSTKGNTTSPPTILVTTTPAATYTPPSRISSSTYRFEDWRDDSDEATGHAGCHSGYSASDATTLGQGSSQPQMDIGHSHSTSSASATSDRMDEEAEYQECDDDVENEDEEEEQDDDYSTSTEVAITAAKSSPLLSLSSAAVGAMTDTEVTYLTHQHAGMQLIQRIILSSVQPAIAGLQSQLNEAHEIITKQAQAHDDIVSQFQQMQMSAQQTSAQILDLHTKSSAAEMRQLAKEFRDNRRAYETARGDLEDLRDQLNEEPTNLTLKKRVQRNGEAVNKLYTDMRNVLHTLQEQCTSCGLQISNFVSTEDANLLTQVSHDG